MANRWHIPDPLEREIVARDRACVYCGVAFADGAGNRGARRSWEHIVNDARIITRENVALCCVSCNASKGSKSLADWLQSKHCVRRSISADSVAPVVRAALGDKFP